MILFVWFKWIFLKITIFADFPVFIRGLKKTTGQIFKSDLPSLGSWQRSNKKLGSIGSSRTFTGDQQTLISYSSMLSLYSKTNQGRFYFNWA